MITKYPHDISKVRDCINSGGFMPDELREWVKQFFASTANLEYHVGRIAAEHIEEEWVEQYPHKHTETMGWDAEARTVMVYIDAPDEGGEICVGTKESINPYDKIAVTEGLVVVVDAATWHGVKPVISGSRTVVLVSDSKKLGKLQ